jgi:hypothetical protein
LVVTAPTPSQAVETSLLAYYHCTGGIADAGVDLKVRITPQVTTAGTLNVRWDMWYEGQARLGSPGYFAAGSRLDLDGAVDIRGDWGNQLQIVGGKDQPKLEPGNYLELPTGLSRGATIEEPGTIELKPGALKIRFTPAAGEWMVNDGNPAVQYAGSWTPEQSPEELDDYRHDVHKATTKDAIARLTFKGTKVAYVGRRAPGLGPVRVLLDGKVVTTLPAQPGTDPDTTLPPTGTETQVVLWESPADLKYEPHTVEIVNVEDKPAYLDAFKVTIGSIAEPPVHDEATCSLTKDPGVVEVNIPGSTPTGTGTQTPTDDPGTDPPTDDPNDPDPNDPDPNDPDPNGNEHDSDATIGGDFVQVVTPTGTSTTTATVTPKSTGPTATKYYRAQVANTPSGGVDTGVAPDEERPPLGLMAGGMALVMGTAGGGLLLRRRRAEHAGGAL